MASHEYFKVIRTVLFAALGLLTACSGGSVVAGGAGTHPHTDVALARYRSDGTLEPTLGRGGKVTTEPSTLAPLAPEEAAKIQSQGADYASQMRRLPLAASAYTAELKTLAEQLWTDPRYTAQVPQQTALIYRLYAAARLLTPSDSDRIAVRSALRWLRKAMELDASITDYPELQAAEQFFTVVADGKVDSVKMQIWLMHVFRVAMPEANAEEVEARVEEAMDIIFHPDMQRAKEDFAYLAAHRIGQATIAQVMKEIQAELQRQRPDQEVGGKPIFVPSPNGNTTVRYIFQGTSPRTFEWEVNKAKALIMPVNDATRDLMEGKSKRGNTTR